jgi:hypothetical protein
MYDRILEHSVKDTGFRPTASPGMPTDGCPYLFWVDDAGMSGTSMNGFGRSGSTELTGSGVCCRGTRLRVTDGVIPSKNPQ